MSQGQDDRRWALRWLGRPVERLSGERRRELIEAAAARGRLSSRGALVRLRGNLLPVGQTAAAAALAWLLANSVLGHQNPVFAPIAAIVSLGATRGQRAQRAIELILGVALGITAGDLLTSVIGVGVWQLAVIVGLAMAAAVWLGAGLLLLSEAGVSATLVATLQPTTHGFPPARLLDVFVGGAVALVFSQLLFPVHPVKLVRTPPRPWSASSRTPCDRSRRQSASATPKPHSRRSTGHGGFRWPGPGSSRRSTAAEKRRGSLRFAGVIAARWGCIGTSAIRWT